MKDIQAGFLTLPTLTYLPTLRQAQGSGFPVKVLILPKQNRDYSGGSVPDFPRSNGDHGVPYTWNIAD
jgi:hypothetical protein